MKSTSYIAAPLAFALGFAATASAFAPKPVVSPTFTKTKTEIHMAIFDGEKEREKLTRDSEPEEFFAT